MRTLRRSVPGVIGLVALAAGCALPDRESFAPAPSPPGAAERALLPPDPAKAALVTVRFAVSSPGYAASIAAAVQAAERRRPGRAYRIVLVTPSVSAPALETGAGDALAVARALIAAGVAPSRVELSGEVNRGLATREIRVFAGV